MGYNQIYKEILNERTPFQIAKSEEIRKRNEKYFEQENALRLAIRERNYPTANHTTQRQVFKATEAFIEKVCRMN